MIYQSFSELPIWKQAMEVIAKTYHLTKSNQLSRDFGLRDQMQRAAVSISSNIAEGFEKNNNKEFIRYLRIAKGSAGELRNQFEIAYNLKYLDSMEYKDIQEELLLLARQISGFIKYLSICRR